MESIYTWVHTHTYIYIYTSYISRTFNSKAKIYELGDNKKQNKTTQNKNTNRSNASFHLFPFLNKNQQELLREPLCGADGLSGYMRMYCLK